MVSRCIACARVVKLAAWGLLLGTVLALVVAAVRTFTFEVGEDLRLSAWEKRDVLPGTFSPQEKAEFLRSFKEAIRIPTVSTSETDLNISALEEFNDFLQKAFPVVFSSSLVQHEIVSDYSHLFKVSGSDPTLQPYMIISHIDVVPAPSDGWDAPPFSAQEINGFIYGRGTLDNKQSLMGSLQALEYLLKRGYKPRRTFYLGFGHDEEVNGLNGAKNIAALLKSRGVKLSFILDEGMAVLDGIIKGLQGPAAIIGVSEKGIMTIKLTVTMKPGHSSTPPRETTIGILSTAVSRLERNPLPSKFGLGPEKAMFEHLASRFDFPVNFVMSNLWLFSPILTWILEKEPSTNALIRTTTAVTMFNAGIKNNIISPYAEAIVNFRIHNAQTTDEVLQIVSDTIADDRVKVEVISAGEPLPISSYNATSFGYQIIKKTAQEIFPQVVVAPGVCVGSSDSKHFVEVCDEILRFVPTWFKIEDLSRFHGLNERISVKNYEEAVKFYFQLFQNCDISKLPEPHAGGHEL
ncbi:N-fatty-acyl-amino acid synthase/hydrolase PM20D1.2-like [Polypterus senegalus]|uniref:N-fatty-acyl-amino acid synthase/hydrolase PM20D1.2-like n=1 Tax=Polypterus senegalus TaxID=55291 RepID=UPI001963BF22|nr:N-fatty-acyl-amino acid synthase/hydrolase PM20D1.2-like [Polypterus senegalus]